MPDMTSMFANILTPIVSFIITVTRTLGLSIATFLILFILGFFILYRTIPRRKNLPKLEALQIKDKPYNLIRWILVDLLQPKQDKFNEYGFTFYCGRQGTGKTISLVHYLNRMKRKYPDCIIVTNFKYKYADFIMKDWCDLINIRNGKKGVIFAIDEIHSEYSSASWKDFPETLLSEISQQRKQRVKIVATSQCFSRVAKPIREQAFSVVQCSTMFKRWTFNREYDAYEYKKCEDNPVRLKKNCKSLAKHNFVQSDYLRGCYDTYEKIERMQKVEFLPRAER